MLKQKQIRRLVLPDRNALQTVTPADNEVFFIQSEGEWWTKGAGKLRRVSSEGFYNAIAQVDFTTAEPSTPTIGDAYINTGTGNGSSTAVPVTANNIYQWDGSGWVEIQAQKGRIVYLESADDLYGFNGTDWFKLGGGVFTSASTPPATADPGDYFYDVDDDILYVRVVDGGGNGVWLDVSTAGAGGASTPLHHASSSYYTTSSSGSSQARAPLGVRHDPAGMISTSTDQFTIQQDGVYLVAYDASCRGKTNQPLCVSLRRNGTILHFSYAQDETNSFGNDALVGLGGREILTLSAGDTIHVERCDTSMRWRHATITVTQLAASVVQTPDTLLVDDQSTSNYMDLGGMRIQWGESPHTSNGTITLPAPFLNTNYSVVATCDSNSGGDVITNVDQKTTTGFNWRTTTAAGGSTSLGMNWVAIGRKP